MSGTFELTRNSEGHFRFVLKAGNQEVLLQSELYTSKAAAEAGIASVRANCSIDERYARKTASNGQYFFNLKAANHQVIGTSQLFASASLREQGIARVKAIGASKIVSA